MVMMNTKSTRRCREGACLVRVKRNKKRHKMIRSVIFSRLPGWTKIGQMCRHSGSPDVETVVREVAWNVCGGQDLPKPVREQSTQKRPPILEQEQRTWNVAPASEICHH